MGIAEQIAGILERTRTIAVVGLSSNPARPSFGVASYLQQQGFRIIPVNPAEKEVLGERAYSRLDEIDEPVDIVDVFRRSEFVPEIADAAIRIKAPVLWLQEGVVHPEAEQHARDAGVAVIADRCLLKEHIRLQRKRTAG